MKHNYTLKRYLKNISSLTEVAQKRFLNNSRYLCAALLLSVLPTVNAQVDPCAAINLPYTLPLASVAEPDLPECVIMENLNGDDKFWASAASTPGITGPVMRYGYSLTLPANDWFYTRKLNLTAGVSYRLNFKTRSAAYEEKLKVAVGSLPTATSMTQTLMDITIPTGMSTAQSQEIDFTVATTGIYNIGFQAHSIPNQNALYVGEVSVENTPTCLIPSGLIADTASITQTSYTFSWTASPTSPANGYEYEVRTSGAAGSGTTGLAASGTSAAGVTTATATGLSASTTYTTYVRAVCSSSDSSNWISSAFVNTVCGSANIPYTLPLASVSVPNLPNCVTIENLNNDNKFWKTATSSTGMTGPVMQYAYSTTLAADDWFYTASLNLTAGVNYRLSYKYRASGYEEKLKVAVGTAAAAVSMTQVLTDVTIPASQSDAVLVVTDFIVPTSGLYNIGFQAHSDANKNSLYIGEMSVVIGPTCLPPTAIIATNLDKNSTTIAWNEPAIIPADGYSYEIRTSGLAGSGATGLVFAGTTAAGIVTADIVGLTPSTEYSIYVSANCATADQSIWSSVVAFTTLCDYIEIEAINDTTCVGSSATLQVSGATTEVSWYATDVSLEVLETGPLFETPELLETTSYWAAASEVLSGQEAQIGEGLSLSNSYQNPFYSLWSNIHSQHIIRASELTAAGLSAGAINSVALTVTNMGSLPMIDLSLKIGTTTASDMAAFVDNANFTVVYNSPSLMPIEGLNVLQFATPYIWDGTSNIVLEFCHGNPNSSASMTRTVVSDATSYISTIKAHVSNSASAAEACGMTTNQKASYSVRPLFTFIGTALCQAPTRTEVIATVNEIPVITADAVQTITVDALEDATLADLTPSGVGINWFPTEADALAFTNELEIGTQLDSGTTYYAVLTENDCRSLPFAVLVTVALGLENNTMSALSYYPNPVNDQLNITYSENITAIAVFNLVGQKVMTQTPNTSNVVLDLSRLAAGTYMIQVNAESASKVIKVVRK